ncbi:SagB/ThcOx family dehydrogenase [Clostridium estertheticum]|uniref:SagB/ThcOx family dehydrogenase n=1 Tax=Clostridium estertheticum TaxID=238834 RepID=A0A5N7IUU3_9CLOT|nr:AMP-binding protein [Clostridium estertheticum]MPQ34078.1 SagB/ThcOx family dehydrogenase [Clostridium estertheticum]MPQ64879.1 SagB/ThcOx family dehydrogenase [Clostridium estertheticum]
MSDSNCIENLGQILKADCLLKKKGINFINKEDYENFVTYEELYSRALNVLACLQNKGIKAGDELIFQINDSEMFLNTFWACIIGGIIAVPIAVGNNKEHRLSLCKIWSILKNPFLITDERGDDNLKKGAYEAEYMDVLLEIDKNAIIISEINNNNFGIKYNSKLNDIALIQFSSGSTGEPKGVVLTHENLIINTKATNNALMTTADDSLLSWMPLTHDMGLICIHIAGVMAGISQHIMSTSLFISNPTIWLKKASEYKVTQLYSPNFGYKHFLDFFHQNKAIGWDLSNVRFILNGAEPISFEVCNLFNTTMEEFGLKRKTMVLGYGLAEATVVVSCAPVGEEVRVSYLDRLLLNIGGKVKEIATCDNSKAIAFLDVGYPINDCYVRIADEDDRALEDDTIGYTQISGKNVTRGYYGDLEATQKVITEDNWFNTGDLGFMRNGRITITGRAKDIIFVNGQNYYPYDIERVAEELEEIELGKIAACGVKSNSSDKVEIILFVLFRKEIKDFIPIATKLKSLINSEMGLDIKDVVPVKEIPKTTSGKVKRYKLGRMYQDGEFTLLIKEMENIFESSRLNVVIDYPTNDSEKIILGIWNEVLDNKYIGINDNFFEIGGNSIRLIQVVDKIEKRFNTTINVSEFVENNTIAKLYKLILNGKSTYNRAKYPERITDLENISNSFALTDIQMAYLIGRHEQFEMGGISTHFYIEIETLLNIKRLNKALQKVIKRHPMMRTIVLSEGNQKILENVPEYEIIIDNLNGLSSEEQETIIGKERDRLSHYVFRTEQWPLFEFKALTISKEKSYLCISMDMLIADGASIQILGKELIDFYNNENLKLNDIKFNFRDYVLACQELKKSTVYEEDKNFWMNKLEDFPQAPSLPMKQDPANIKKPRFNRLKKIFDNNSWDRFKVIAKKNNVIPSAILCAIYAEVLAYWSNQPKMTINLTGFNRYPFNKDVNNIIGDFTTVMLVDIDMESGFSFWERVKKLQKKIFIALDHRHYDGVELIREIAKNNNMGVKAVMPIVFTSMLFNDTRDAWSEIGESKFGISQTSQVFIDNQIMDINGCLSITWDYVEQLFDKDVIEPMFEQFTNLITSIVANEDICGFKLSCEHSKLIEKYNDTNNEFIPTTLQKLFIEQVNKTPQNIAIEYENDKITYSELHQKSNKIAHFLHDQNIGSGDIVGVLAYRCIDTIVNIMGILKSGAAYVPIEPEYPENRKKFIISDAKCKITLEPNFYTKNNIEAFPEDNIDLINKPEDIAYVIYTSGSTGKPKGVVITHKAVTNTIIDINNKFNVNENDKIMGISSMCFDLSVYDIFGALSSGAALVLVKDQRDVVNLVKTVEDHKVTIWNSAPAVLDLAIDSIAYDFPEKNQKQYFWSPMFQWSFIGNQLYVGNKTYPGNVGNLFPKLYFISQNGITLKSMHREFPSIDILTLDSIFNKFVDDKIFIDSILTPEELFTTQSNLFDNPYGEKLRFDPEEYEKYKKAQQRRIFEHANGRKYLLRQTRKFPKFINNRETHRIFREDKFIPFSEFAQLLSVFRGIGKDGNTKFYYPSSGGLYSLDVFVYVKENRIESVKAGLYYYNPIENSITLVNEGNFITENEHYHGNRSIFNSSAFSIFLVYNAEANMPKYNTSGYFYACIDTGIMVSTLTQAAELLNIGLCSIGSMFFEKVRDYFCLNKNSVLMHTIEGGMKVNGTSDDIWNNFEEYNSKCALVEATVSIDTLDKNYMNENVTQQKVIDIKKLSNKCAESLRLILLSGDWIPSNLPEKTRNHYPNSEIISLGGATEGSIWSIFYPIKEVKSEWNSIPYGYPLQNQRFYVLNYENKLCPIGVKGELCIAGTGLAKKYLNDKEKTKKAFIDHNKLGRLYKTGDYGIMHKEGYIEFIGRKDYQVKIRGYRVEMGEIEHLLMKHKEINNAILIDCTDPQGKKSLCAYIVSNKDIPVSVLREYLSNDLPVYMIPAHFVYLNTIPLTPNGKVDRKSLPEPDFSIDYGTEFIEPTSDIEEELTNVWKNILNIDKIGLNDNFFELGGSSASLIRAHSNIEKLYPGKLGITDLFAYPTISKLAEFINKKKSISIKDIGIELVKFPEEYIVKEKSLEAYSDFKFDIKGDMLESIKNIAMLENISTGDILLSVYIYMFSEISKSQQVVVQLVNKNQGQALNLSVDLDKLRNLSDLFKEVSTMKVNSYGNLYSISDISKIGIHKDKNSILPLFYDSKLISINSDLLDTFDIIVGISELSDYVVFTCEYNANKLRKEKVKDMLSLYLKIIEAVIIKY